MKRSILGLLAIVFLLWSCGGNTSEENDPQTDDIDSTVTEQEISVKDFQPGDKLIIQGDNVNMRTQPKIGDNVVKQLNTGDETIIIERGRKAKIGEMVDYWYKVKHDGREMWVFGAITSMKADALSMEQEEDEKEGSEEANVIRGKFMQILETEDASFFVLKDENDKRLKLQIHSGYEGQEIFAENSEDMKGADVIVRWEKQTVYWESAGGNVEIDKILKVEMAE